MKIFLFITVSLLISLCASAQNAADELYAEAILSSNQLIPGEPATFQIHIVGGKPDSKPVEPEMPNTQITFTGNHSQIINNRQQTSVLSYRIVSTEPGIYQIPSFTVSSGGNLLQTQPLSYKVSDIASLNKVPTGIEGVNILTTWLPNKSTLYPGQQTAVTLKLYTPEILNVVNWGILSPSKENCLVWRFASAATQNSKVMINGERYVTESLTSTLSGISPGTASLKASELEATIRQVVSESRFTRNVRDYSLDLVIPDLDLEIIPFPPGAPEDFDGAVGNFEILSHSEKPSFKSNEPTEVILKIGGIGNLESLKAPKIGESAYSDLQWKIISTTKEARGRERREQTGVVTFRQLIRPQVKNREVLNQPNLTIPSYSFSFFNPATKVYKTLTTDPIPVEIIPAAEAPLTEEEIMAPTEEIKPEAMTQILDVIQQPDVENTLSSPGKSRFPLWHIAPAALCLFIVSLPFLKKIRARFTKTTDQKDQQKDIRELSKHSTSSEFYAAAGRYISRWMAHSDDAQLQEIINERDEICFQSETSGNEAIQSDRKKEILDLIKKLSIVILSIGIFSSDNNLSAAEEQTPLSAYSSGDYQKALDLYQQSYPSSLNSIYGTPADVFYNIGNCYQKLADPGNAALSWRRALAVDSTHEDARKNLRFIEEETLAYTQSYQPWQGTLTKYQIGTYKVIYQISIWIFALSLLCILFLKSAAWVRASVGTLVVLMVITPFTAGFGYAAAYLYPDTDFHTDYAEQAVITSEASLYQQARRKSDNFQVLTPASLVKIIATRDSWSLVQIIEDRKIADPQQGWLKTDQLKAITAP